MCIRDSSMLRYTYPYHFSAITAQWYAWPKMIVIYGVIGFPAALIIQEYCQQHTHIQFAGKVAMIYPVVFTIQRNPIIFLHTHLAVSYTQLDVYKRQAVADDDAICYTGFGCFKKGILQTGEMVFKHHQVCLLYTSRCV